MQDLETISHYAPFVVAPPQPDLQQAMSEATNHHLAGRLADAEEAYRAILAVHPSHAIANYNLGLLYQMQGRLQEAVDAYLGATAIKPDYAEAYINLGAIRLTLGQPEAAAALFRQAIAVSPGSAMAFGNLGKALQDLGRIDEAIVAYRDAMQRQPDNAIVNVNLGGALLEQKAWDESLTVTRHAIALQPDNAMAHANLGTALLSLGRHQEALAACRHAMTLHPQTSLMQATLGGAMLELGAWQEAEALCRHAVILDPTLPNGYFNLSHTLKATNQLHEAAVTVRQAIALRPDSADYHFHLAHVLLVQGDFEEGWVEYDWRWKLPDFAWLNTAHGTFSQPQWLGEDISDKTILIYTEQGIGDIIQFARYLPLVVRKAGQVIVAVQPPLRRLLETIEGITIVSMQQRPLPAFDVHCGLLSLPRAFATRLDTIPAIVPYLRVNPDEKARWAGRVSGSALKVGIVWAGNPATKRDRFRSPGLNAIAPVFSVPGVDFIILQVGPGREDGGTNQWPSHVLDLGAEVNDLADTAAIMSGLDLMISSCTGPLHLAGALGVPTWAMIPFAPYFPWLLDRTDSHWYPSVHLYRQEQPGQDWSGVVGRVADDLAAMSRSRAAESQRCLAASVSRPAQGFPPQRDAGVVACDRVLSQEQAALSKSSPPNVNTGGFSETTACHDKFMIPEQKSKTENRRASVKVNNFAVIESEYGKFIVNRYCAFQAESLIKTGRPHIQAELDSILTIVGQLPPNSVFVDAGANIGLVALPIAQFILPRGGVVHAFEVQRMMYYALCGSAALNDLENVIVYNKALGARAHTLGAKKLDYSQPQDFGLFSLTDQTGIQVENIEVVTIDSLNLPRLDFLKIDVEGMEVEVLKGAAKTIKQHLPFGWIEYWKVDVADIKAAFAGLDYKFYFMDPLNMLCVPVDKLMHIQVHAPEA